MRLWRFATVVLAFLLSAGFAMAPAPLQQIQERTFDRLLLPALASRGDVVVVDIGAVDETGLPWTRASTARLVAKLAETAPKVVGFDMLFAGDCDSLAAQDLARSLKTVPAVLGFLLMDQPGPDLPRSTLALTGNVALWPAKGADAPCPAFASADMAAMALMGDSDGIVRRVPVGVAIGAEAHPGLAVAVATRALGGQALAGQNWLHLEGGVQLPAVDGTIRFVPTQARSWAGRTLQAADVLAGRASPPQGAVILTGSSLPQRGGLRPTSASPVTPSVQIQADAVSAMLAGHLPYRPAWAAMLEAGFVILTSLFGIWLMARLRPAVAAGGVVVAAALWGTLAMLAGRLTGMLIDPILPAAAVALVLLAAITGRAASAARAERVLRDRMGQLLPPTLVSRLAAQPQLMRLEGEMRDVTAMFTDIEGFTKATAEMGAQEMVAQLDAYFTLTCAIVLKHGGMIDKLVGDSVHALFNAPLDQPGHEAAAVACAAEIIAATEEFLLRKGGFGRTRIGLECGLVVLGDVGFGTRIDYTAHGPAVNLAARLQETNKVFGSQICIGPTLASRIKGQSDIGLAPLGQADIRSHGLMMLYTLKV